MQDIIEDEDASKPKPETKENDEEVQSVSTSKALDDSKPEEEENSIGDDETKNLLLSDEVIGDDDIMEIDKSKLSDDDDASKPKPEAKEIDEEVKSVSTSKALDDSKPEEEENIMQDIIEDDDASKPKPETKEIDEEVKSVSSSKALDDSKPEEEENSLGDDEAKNLLLSDEVIGDEDDDDDIMEIDKSKLSDDDDDVMEIGRRSRSQSPSEQDEDDDDDEDIIEIASKSQLLSDDEEDDEDDIVEIAAKAVARGSDEEDIIEIEEPDPLGGMGMDDSNDLSDSDKDSIHSSIHSSDESPEDFSERKNEPPIVVSDSKSLADLVASTTVNGNNNNVTVSKEQSKEPTLVIIDTNSILSGRGPVPIDKRGGLPTSIANQLNSGTTVRPLLRSDILVAPQRMHMQTSTIKIPDDAFLIEAPSFIVPYVFEQAGEKVLKDHLKDLKAEIRKEKVDKAAANGDPEPAEEEVVPEKKKTEDYFESPVGKLLLNVGMNLVQEFVQVDLLKLQRRKAEKERSKNRMGSVPIQTQQSIISLKNNIEESKENNEPFRFPIKKCRSCNFKTESELVMSTHLETPHMRNSAYRCNFCKFNTKLPQDILFHMQREHLIKPRLERAPGIHQCPHCAFEDNSKAKLTRHLIGCVKRFKLERNLEPPQDWDTPGKLPKMPKNRLLQQGNFNSASAYIAAQQQTQQRNVLVQYPTMSSMTTNKYIPQGIRMSLPPLLQAPRAKPVPGLIRTNTNNRTVHHQGQHQQIHIGNNVNQSLPRGMIMRNASGQIINQQNLQFSNNQILQQVVGGQIGLGGTPKAPGFLSNLGLVSNSSTAPQQRTASQQHQQQQMQARMKQNSQPSISITPLPRQSTAVAPAAAAASLVKPAGKTSFVICEICDGYIKDLDQLRNHMQWIHKVKIHPKMIYNKPPLNCQKCQFRFFTDQGLERHLLGSHGLVTSSMQEAANKGQDNGRCPLCGKVYQWKLLAHVAKDHNVTLKPAHLSYKCTVCTATFGMYKLFESHVYSAHSMNSKKNNNNPGRQANNTVPNPNRGNQMQVTTRQMPTSTQNSFKPMKINDEITIIPQPMANSAPLRSKGSLTITPHSSTPMRRSLRNVDGDEGIEIIEIDESPRGSANGRKENGEFRGRLPISESTLRKRNLEISVCGTDSDNSDDSFQRAPPKRLRQQ